MTIGLPFCDNVHRLTTGTYGTSVAGSATANTWGSWIELIAATSYSTDWVTINALNPLPSASGGHIMGLQLGIGASTAEVEWTEPLLIDVPAARRNGHSWSFAVPHAIEGARISARVRCDAANTGCTINVDAWGSTMGDSNVNQVHTAYGQTIDASNTIGTAVDTGGTTGTKSAWVQLTGSTLYNTDYISVEMLYDDNTGANNDIALDIAQGDLSSKNILLPDLTFMSRSATDIIQPGSMTFKRRVRRARSLFVRAAGLNTNAANRVFQVYVICGG